MNVFEYRIIKYKKEKSILAIFGVRTGPKSWPKCKTNYNRKSKTVINLPCFCLFDTCRSFLRKVSNFMLYVLVGFQSQSVGLAKKYNFYSQSILIVQSRTDRTNHQISKKLNYSTFRAIQVHLTFQLYKKFPNTSNSYQLVSFYINFLTLENKNEINK